MSVVDLLSLLAAWGPGADGCVLADLDLDGGVDGDDLQALLDDWG